MRLEPRLSSPPLLILGILVLIILVPVVVVRDVAASWWTFVVHLIVSVNFKKDTELVADTLEQLLNGSRVAQESNSRLQSTRTPRRDVALSRQDVVGNSCNEIGRVLF